jgi:hypothetical protein
MRSPDTVRCGRRHADPFREAQLAATRPLGAEAIDLARQLAAAGISPGEIEAAHAAAFGRGEEVGALAGLHDRVAKIVGGSWRSIMLPWRILTVMALPLLPGNLVVFSGTVGSSKTIFTIQAMLHLLAAGVDCVMIGIEGDRPGYLLRALAQLSDISDVTKPDWVAATPDRMRGLLCEHAAVLREFSRHLVIAAELGIETHAQAIELVEQEAQNGRRVVFIDPVTLLDRIAGMKPWDADAVFAKAMKRVAMMYSAAVWCVTHPVKGSTEPTRENLSGGAVFERNSDVILTLGNHDPKVSSVQTDCGTSEITHNRTLGIAKARHGPGTGARLAYQFDTKTLTLRELGVIVKRHKEKAW